LLRAVVDDLSDFWVVRRNIGRCNLSSVADVGIRSGLDHLSHFALPVGDSGRFVRCAQGNHLKAHSMIVLSHERSCVRANLHDDPSRGTTWRSDVSPNKPPGFDIPHHRDPCAHRPTNSRVCDPKCVLRTMGEAVADSGASRLDIRAGCWLSRNWPSAAPCRVGRSPFLRTVTSNDLRRL